jgi:hypothetical protein
MSSQTRSAALRSAAWATLASLAFAGLAQAQNIPNPLVRPQRGAETVPVRQPAAAQSAAQPSGAAAAPSGRAAAGAGRGGEGLPAEERGEEKTVAELLGGLYVSTVIGDRAVLRSLDVRTVPGLVGNVGATIGSGAGGGGGGGGAAAGGGGGGGSGSNTGISGLRSQVYIVRNGEVMSMLDRLRVLVRVRDTTVTLFDVTDIPPGQYDPLDLMDRGFPVAFRGSVDSMQSLPPTPGTLIRPGEGVDGEAFERARNTSGDSSSGGSSNTRTTTGGGGGLGNP